LLPNTRRKMVDAAAKVVLKDNKYLKEWTKLSRKIEGESKNRNRIAHFGLISHTNSKRKTETYLLKPSIFNVANQDREYDIKQIKVWQKSFNSLAADMSKFLNNLPAALRA